MRHRPDPDEVATFDPLLPPLLKNDSVSRVVNLLDRQGAQTDHAFSDQAVTRAEYLYPILRHIHSVHATALCARCATPCARGRARDTVRHMERILNRLAAATPTPTPTPSPKGGIPWTPNAPPSLPGVTGAQLNVFWGYAEGVGLAIAFFAFAIAAIIALVQWKGHSVGGDGNGIGRMPKILFAVCALSLTPTIITTIYTAMS